MAQTTPSNVTAMLLGPAAKPPLGVEPDFDIWTSAHSWVLAIFILQWVLVTLALAMRLFTRWFILKVVVVEDFIFALGVLSQAGENVPAFWLVSGFARHMWDIRLMDFFQNLYYLSIATAMYGIAITCIKVAILAQFIRLFTPKRRMNPSLFVGSWVCIVAAVVFYVIIIPISSKMCVPETKYWNPILKKQQGLYCGNPIAIRVFFASGVFNVVTDFAVLLLPLPAIFKLKMRLRKRLAIASLFATGVVACAASIVRTIYSWQILVSTDKSWNICIMGIWTWVEFTAGALVFCLPVWPKFYRVCEERIRIWYGLSPPDTPYGLTQSTKHNPVTGGGKVMIDRSFRVDSETASTDGSGDSSRMDSTSKSEDEFQSKTRVDIEHV